MSLSLKNLANSIRILSCDMVESAQSGHPGTPLGAADIMVVLFSKFLRFSAQNPDWHNRDRFILSAGHASAMLYSMLYLTGYKGISLDDIKKFRQLGSKMAGHPEYGHLPGVEVTTGPLGQGIANAVGMAISERVLNAKYGDDTLSHRTFVLCGDGCLMEGVALEAIALAGHLKLEKLTLIYDKNDITIDGRLSLASSLDVKKFFESNGWAVYECDGHNFEDIESALGLATKTNGMPSIVIAKTIIGYGSTKAGSEKSHGSPLGKDAIAELRKALDWTHDPFVIPSDIKKSWEEIGARYDNSTFNNIELPSKSELLNAVRTYKQNIKSEKSTRELFGDLLEVVQDKYKFFIGGSADLSGSNNTKSTKAVPITQSNYNGNYIHYGIREHAMGAIMNGIAAYGHGLIPFGGTFLAFSDYMRPPVRLAALMGLPVIFIFTHDSIALGEDGPTHQPIEHIDALRIIPNLNVFRPCDAAELSECFEIAVTSTNRPSALLLTRQKVPYLRHDNSQSNLSANGGYVIRNGGESPKVIFFATGSEVGLACSVYDSLKDLGISSNVVSVPCLELCRPELFQNNCLSVFIEAGKCDLFKRFAKPTDLVFGIDTFGKSGSAKDLYEHFGFTNKNILAQVLSVLKV